MFALIICVPSHAWKCQAPPPKPPREDKMRTEAELSGMARLSLYVRRPFGREASSEEEFIGVKVE